MRQIEKQSLKQLRNRFQLGQSGEKTNSDFNRPQDCEVVINLKLENPFASIELLAEPKSLVQFHQLSLFEPETPLSVA